MTGRPNAHSSMRTPKISMPTPVHRLMWTPAALAISALLSISPTMVSTTPYTTNSAPISLLGRLDRRVTVARCGISHRGLLDEDDVEDDAQGKGSVPEQLGRAPPEL